MDTIFAGNPIEATIFSLNDARELAYVVWEDEGDYWSILVSLGKNWDSDGSGDSVVEIIEKDVGHPSPEKYAEEQYREAVRLVKRLLTFNPNNSVIVVERQRRC